ncbi:NIN isoform 11, partial [Pan troglodytes]
QLLWQENERLQTVVQNTKAELTHSREKVRQLESNLLPKHQKHLNPSGTMKPTEQEQLSLKRECDQFQKEQSPANRKVSQMNSLEQELETIHLENEGLKKKQVKLDEQLMENSVVGSSREGCSSLPEIVCEDAAPEVHCDA